AEAPLTVAAAPSGDGDGDDPGDDPGRDPGTDPGANAGDDDGDGAGTGSGSGSGTSTGDSTGTGNGTGNGTGGPLASTGADLATVLTATLLLLGAGAVLVRRRRELGMALQTAFGRMPGED